MKEFNVITYDFNRGKFVPYNVIPYLVGVYNKEQPDLESFDDFKEFVRKESMYQFWGRCEYEIILVDWPCQKKEEKWDVYEQILMNLDLITETLIWNLMKENNEHES